MNKASSVSANIVKAAINRQASDIHFIPQQEEVQVYFRCNGNRFFVRSLLPHHYSVILSYYKFTGKMDIGESKKPQHGTISFQANNQSYFLRLSTLPANNTESLAIRILPQRQVHSLHQLFLFPYQLNKIRKWLQFRSGLILLTGATGSGKTTALYAMVKALMEENNYQTITLEDPIEKPVKDVLQVQVNEKAGITYDVGLKAALRHDPDVIMVGEIRDKATAQFAFRASNTGHLVLSTLHANNASGTIHRLLEMGITPLDIEQNLVAVAAIQLLSMDNTKYSNQRAAIVEILDQHHIIDILHAKSAAPTFSFSQLRRKAYAYGYIVCP